MAKKQSRKDRSLLLTAYALSSRACALAVAGPKREWMDHTPKRFAYQCLPMVIANQAGWLALNQQKFVAVWNGGPDPADLKIEYLEPPVRNSADSIFGSGILTFGVGHLFRTPPGYNLHVRGPANCPKDGVCALEGIVESDWTEALFTMNWKITRPNHPVTFDAEEPIAMITPMQRRLLERFTPEIKNLSDNPDLAALHDEWRTSRLQHNAERRNNTLKRSKKNWQRHYLSGLSIRLEKAKDHQTTITLKRFVDKRSKQSPAKSS